RRTDRDKSRMINSESEKLRGTSAIERAWIPFARMSISSPDATVGLDHASDPHAINPVTEAVRAGCSRRGVTMTDPFPNPDRPIDRSVRAKLDADARDADPERVLAGVRRRLAADTVSPVRRTRRWVFAAAGVLAASVLVAVLLLIPGGSVQASPREVVERAKAVHETPTDRCYEVTVHFPDDLRERYPKLAANRKSRLWTRGDRYFVELPDGRGSWGRDEAGRVWIAPTASAGARFDADEVPGILREFFEVRTVQLPRLLDELLSDWDLAWTTADPGRSRGDRKIVATRWAPNGSSL